MSLQTSKFHNRPICPCGADQTQAHQIKRIKGTRTIGHIKICQDIIKMEIKKERNGWSERDEHLARSDR